MLWYWTFLRKINTNVFKITRQPCLTPEGVSVPWSNDHLATKQSCSLILRDSDTLNLEITNYKKSFERSDGEHIYSVSRYVSCHCPTLLLDSVFRGKSVGSLASKLIAHVESELIVLKKSQYKTKHGFVTARHKQVSATNWSILLAAIHLFPVASLLCADVYIQETICYKQVFGFEEGAQHICKQIFFMSQLLVTTPFLELRNDHCKRKCIFIVFMRKNMEELCHWRELRWI